MSEESVKNPPTTNNSFASKKIGKYSSLTVKFNGNCLR